MTFLQYHKTVIRSSGVEGSSDYIRILWHYGYTLEQAIHNLKTLTTPLAKAKGILSTRLD